MIMLEVHHQAGVAFLKVLAIDIRRIAEAAQKVLENQRLAGNRVPDGETGGELVNGCDGTLRHHQIGGV